jgi:hypothetical protein
MIAVPTRLKVVSELAEVKMLGNATSTSAAQIHTP